jgi:hypothetical protein
MFSRNLGIHLQTYTVSKPKKPQPKFLNSICFTFSEIVIHVPTLKYTHVVICVHVEGLPFLSSLSEKFQIIILGHGINYAQCETILCILHDDILERKLWPAKGN